VGFTIGSRGEVPGKRKPVIRGGEGEEDYDVDYDNNNNNRRRRRRRKEDEGNYVLKAFYVYSTLRFTSDTCTVQS
jgi:hypothetical protein